MREIKFRAWDGKQMWSEQDLIDNDYFLRANGRIFNELLGEEDHGFKVMQFTGLTDKNGKDIYEGDIIRQFFPSTKDYYSGEVYYADWCRYEVGDCWALVDGESQIEDGESTKWEIIGNIYEHPELLEGGE